MPVKNANIPFMYNTKSHAVLIWRKVQRKEQDKKEQTEQEAQEEVAPEEQEVEPAKWNPPLIDVQANFLRYANMQIVKACLETLVADKGTKPL